MTLDANALPAHLGIAILEPKDERAAFLGCDQLSWVVAALDEQAIGAIKLLEHIHDQLYETKYWV